jgi:hypothetical protein
LVVIFQPGWQRRKTPLKPCALINFVFLNLSNC